MAAGVVRRAGALLACLGLLAACVTSGAPAPAKPPQPAAAPLPAAEPTYRVRLSLDESTVELLGELTLLSAHEAAQLLMRRPQVKTLRLTSPGGHLGPALVLADVVARQGLTVYVPLYCASACTLVLAAGRERLLAPGARLAYHSASAPLGDQRAAEALAGYGLPAAFIARIQATPHASVWHPTLAELKAARAITGVAPDPAPPRLAADPLELAGWAAGREPLLEAYGAAFPDARAALRAATLAYLRGEPGAEAALLALAPRMADGLLTALPRASDAALRAFFALQRDRVKTLRDTAPALCVGPDAEVALEALDPAALDAQSQRNVEVMTLVFQSYAAAPVALDRARVEQRVASFARGLYSGGRLSESDVALLNHPERNPVRFCDVMVTIFDAALDDPGAADVLRGLALALERDLVGS